MTAQHVPTKTNGSSCCGKFAHGADQHASVATHFFGNWSCSHGNWPVGLCSLGTLSAYPYKARCSGSSSVAASATLLLRCTVTGADPSFPLPQLLAWHCCTSSLHDCSILCSTGSVVDTALSWAVWAACLYGPCAQISGSQSGTRAAENACCGTWRPGTGAAPGQGAGLVPWGVGSRGICHFGSAPWPSQWTPRWSRPHVTLAGSRSWTCLKK